MKKLFCLVFALLLLFCGCKETVFEAEVNTVEGVYMELEPGHTDRRASITVTNENFKRYCSDCSFEIQQLRDGKWYSLESADTVERKSFSEVFKRERSDRIYCVWDNTYGQLAEGHYRLILTLYEGLVLGETEPFYLAAEFDIGPEHYTEALYVRDDAPPVTVNCGGEMIKPYSHFNYSFDFEVNADGTSIESALSEHASEIPSVVYDENLEITLNKNTEFRDVLVYSEDCDLFDSFESVSALSELPGGTYYVGISTVSYYEYSEEWNMFSYSGHTGIFRMEKP